MKDENEIYITQSWVINSNPNQYHPKNKHPNSVISGVMFFDENDDESLLRSGFTEHWRCFPWNSNSTF